MKVLYRATGIEQQRLYQGVAIEHPFVTLVAETTFAQQVPALLGPHRHALLLGGDTRFVRDFRLTDAARALDAERRALGCNLMLGENTTTSARQKKGQRVPALTRFAHGLYRFSWVGADQDFGRPLAAAGVLYRADELRRLLGGLTFRDVGTMDAALGGDAEVQRFATSRPTLFCFDRSVATAAAGEEAGKYAPPPARLAPAPFVRMAV